MLKGYSFDIFVGQTIEPSIMFITKTKSHLLIHFPIQYVHILCMEFDIIYNLVFITEGWSDEMYIYMCVFRTINKLMPGQNGHHFPNDIFEWIFLNENVWILIKISLKFVP